MYCSSCGMTVSPSLSYCNRCGAEVNLKERGLTRPSEASPDALVGGIIAATVFGLGGIIGLMAVMKEVLHFNDGLIIAFSLLFFLSFLAADSVFVWLLLRPKRDAKAAERLARQQELTTNGLGETKARALAEPALSVTEHTTRTLEPTGRPHQTE